VYHCTLRIEKNARAKPGVKGDAGSKVRKKKGYGEKKGKLTKVRLTGGRAEKGAAERQVRLMVGYSKKKKGCKRRAGSVSNSSNRGCVWGEKSFYRSNKK